MEALKILDDAKLNLVRDITTKLLSIGKYQSGSRIVSREIHKRSKIDVAFDFCFDETMKDFIILFPELIYALPTYPYIPHN